VKKILPSSAKAMFVGKARPPDLLERWLSRELRGGRRDE